MYSIVLKEQRIRSVRYSNFTCLQVLAQHSANLYAANGAGVVFAEKGHFDVSKDIFTQARVVFFMFFLTSTLLTIIG